MSCPMAFDFRPRRFGGGYQRGGGTRNSSTPVMLQRWLVSPAAIAGVRARSLVMLPKLAWLVQKLFGPSPAHPLCCTCTEEDGRSAASRRPSRSLCQRLANRSGWGVLAVDYRLAPEHPYPAAIEVYQVRLISSSSNVWHNPSFSDSRRTDRSNSSRALDITAGALAA